MNRRARREHCFKLLFIMDFHPVEEAKEQVELYWEQVEVLKEEEKKEVADRLFDILSDLSEIDAQLALVTHGWRLERLGCVERAILRLAGYEIRFDEQVPYKVAINEAVELAKSFGGEESASFVNGILAKLEG